MALPRVASPKFTIKLPSNSREIRFRPFVVKEEKILLMAMESKDTKSMMDAMIDVASACVDEPEFDVSKLPYFDVEYLFLNLRAKSVGEKAKLQYRHSQGMNYAGVKCEEVTPVEVDLESVSVDVAKRPPTKFKINDKYGIQLRYPTLADVSALSTNEKTEIDLIARCIELVYDDSEVYEPDDLSDARAFVESLSSSEFKAISNFFENMPKLRHTVKYKCKGCGQEDSVDLEGIADFF